MFAALLRFGNEAGAGVQMVANGATGVRSHRRGTDGFRIVGLIDGENEVRCLLHGLLIDFPIP